MNAGRTRLQRFLIPAASALLAAHAAAGVLEPRDWQVTGPNADRIGAAFDHDLSTWWESGAAQTPGTALLIDLRRSMHVYRVFLTCGPEWSGFPRSLNVYVGEAPETLRLVARESSLQAADEQAPPGSAMDIRESACLRFAPVQGRYVKLEIGPNGAGLPWAIAEMEIRAAGRDVPAQERMAVVVDREFLPTGAAAPFQPLRFAAEELQYYLMELTDSPVDVIAADDAAADRGLRFRLVTPPAEQIPAPVPDPDNLEDVSVTLDDNEVSLSGPTPRAVLFAVYEFLESQGIRWLYPSPHGDFVPRRERLDLAVLPLRYRPPFSTRGYMAHAITGVPQEQYSRFLMRHRLTMGETWTRTPLGVIPRHNCAFGWAHTMGHIFQEKGESLEKTHPEWWPGPYRKGWYRVPCTSDPDVIDFAYKAIEDAIRQRAEKNLPGFQGVSVHPNDSACFCECPRCEERFGKPERVVADGAEESNGTWNYSEHHFHMIDELAKRLKRDHPELFLKTLAYANHERPPSRIESLPDNVQIDICPWWAPLPVDAPQNQHYRDLIASWRPWCRSLGIWSYVLIYSDTTFGYPAGEKNLVAPNLRALADQNAFYRRQGIRLVSTQVMGPQQHWPWGLYAFTRTTWRPDETPDTLMDDFFRGYYGAAAGPMRQWYETLEARALEEDLDSSVPDPRLIGPETIEPLRELLAEAAARAQLWPEKERVEQARYDTEWTYRKGRWQTETDRPYPCYRLAAPPAMDGKLDDPAWRNAPELAGFRIAATRIDADRPGRFAHHATTSFRMGWDDGFLYMAARCREPDMDKVAEAAAQDKEFAYRDAVEMFFAPEAPPFYRQMMVSAAGHVWGPVKIRRVNSHQPIESPELLIRTGRDGDAWTIEARIPWDLLAEAAPKDGDLWPANLVRVSQQGRAAGEQYSSWSDLPRYHFHQYNLGTWSLIAFRNATPAPAAAREEETDLNAGFERARSDYAELRRRWDAFEERVGSLDNLAVREKGAVLHGVSANVWENANRGRRHIEIVWKDEPVSFGAVRIRWSGRHMFRRWYSLEYWDGSQYRLIEERRENPAEISTHTFEPVTAGRLRLTVWGDMEGWGQMAMVQALEVYE